MHYGVIFYCQNGGQCHLLELPNTYTWHAALRTRFLRKTITEVLTQKLYITSAKNNNSNTSLLFVSYFNPHMHTNSVTRMFSYIHNHYQYLWFCFFLSPTLTHSLIHTQTHTHSFPLFFSLSLHTFCRKNTEETFFFTITVLPKLLSADNQFWGKPLSSNSGKQFRIKNLQWAPTQKHSVLHLLTARSYLLELKPIVEVWEMWSNATTGRTSTLASKVSIRGAMQETDEDDGHVVAAQAPHLAVWRQAAHHQLFTDLVDEVGGGGEPQ